MKVNNRIFLMVILFLSQLVYPQTGKPIFEIISKNFGNGEFHVEYIINSSMLDEKYDLKLLLYDDKKNLIRGAFKFSGDKEVIGDQQNTIYWYWSKDRDIKPTISKVEIIIEKINKIMYNLVIIGRSDIKITLDGNYKGTLGKDSNYLLARGKHNLKAELNGFETYETVFYLYNNEETIRINLKENKKTEIAETNKNKYERTWFDNKANTEYQREGIGAVEFCLFGNEKITEVTPKLSLYGAFYYQTINPSLISTAVKYPFFEQVKNRSLLGGGLKLTLLPFSFDVDFTVDIGGIKSKDVAGSERITLAQDSVLFKMNFYRIKGGLCPFVISGSIYPYVGIVSQTVTVDLQTNNLKKDILLDYKTLSYQEFGLFANITFRLSNKWVLVVGYEKFNKKDAFDGGFYTHLGLYL